MTSALPPSIWWERPPSFWNLRGCAPCRGGGDRPASGSLCWGRRTGAARGAPSASASGNSGHLRHHREAGRRAGRQAEGD